jgi:hypothetical protein
MTPYPVTVTASYDAAHAPLGTLERLRVWEGEADGRTFIVDESISPVRWTATADYLVDAPTAHEAERAAVQRFVTESAQAGLTVPETVLGATGPIG